MRKSSIFKIFIPCTNLHSQRQLPTGSRSGENFPDPATYPTKKVWIRLRNPAVRSHLAELAVVVVEAVDPGDVGLEVALLRGLVVAHVTRILLPLHHRVYCR